LRRPAAAPRWVAPTRVLALCILRANVDGPGPTMASAPAPRPPV